MENIIPIYWQEPKNKIHLRTISKYGLNGDRWTGALAQLVEQWTENPCVPGSIPGGTTRTTLDPILTDGVFLCYLLKTNVLCIFKRKSRIRINSTQYASNRNWTC